MRTFSPSRRALALTCFTGALALALVPAAAQAASAPAMPAAAAPATACTVSAADVTWGFKESFRSYVSGSIAKGAWEVQDGASYETPNFSWTGGTGWFDAATQTGEVSFTGGIHFTGHNGLLDTTVQNPTLLLTGPGTAQVLIDISGVSMEDALAGSTEAATLTAVPLVNVDMAAASIEESDKTLTLSAAAAPTSITADGFAAFGNYETGTPFDPIALTVSAECPVADPQPSPTETVVLEAAEVSQAESTGTNWVLLAAIAAAAVAVFSAAAAVLATRRRRAVSGAVTARDEVIRDAPGPGAQK